MAYTKTVWLSGDTITSTKLNKIETQLETLSALDKVNTITSSSTNTEYPSAKAVYDFVLAQLGDIESLLEDI